MPRQHGVVQLTRLYCRPAMLVGLAVATSVLISGCWDRQELDRVTIVTALGIDAAGITDFKVTAQIAGLTKAPAAGGSSKIGASDQAALTTYSGTGLTVADAITRGLYQVSTHKMYFPHNAAVVWGNEAARRGMDSVMDFLLRHQEFRANMWVLIARSDAESVIKTPMGHETAPARALAALVENEIRVGNARASQLHQLAEQMLDKTRAATTALVAVDSQGAQPGLNVVGTAVLKKGGLVGELDQRSTRGLMWALGEVKGGSITVQCKCGGYCSIMVNHVKGEITGKMKDGRPEITVTVTEAATVDSLECSEDLTWPGTIEFLNAQQTQLIEGEIREALKRAREMNADIFGFGAAVHAKYRGDWKAIEGQWDTLFAEAAINIKVQARLQYISLLSRPFVTREAK